MKKLAAIIVAVLVLLSTAHAQTTRVVSYRAAVRRIIAEATSPGATQAAWDHLAEMTDKFPARLSGSANLEHAIAWAADRLKSEGFDNVRVDPVMVPHWVRGRETAEIVSPYPQPIAVTALGGSIATAPEGVQGEVVVVKNFDELTKLGAAVAGKIVLYNFKFRTDIDPLAAYLEVRPARIDGIPRAAAMGAAAVLLRSIGPTSHRNPHTGSMRYAAGSRQIPAAAISAEDAEKLQRMQDRGDRVTVKLVLGSQTLPDAQSGNVIAELKGREKPDEVVLISGHFDSWDLAAGAMDDGGGVIAAWEALRTLQRLKLTPRRTIRLVLFTNEENGGNGGTAYRDKYKEALGKHVLMLESDDGVAALRGWHFKGSERAHRTIADIARLTAPLGASRITPGDIGGDDIEPSVDLGVPGISADVDMSRYFFIHHTAADTAEHVPAQDLARVSAAIASMAYVVADLPEGLPRK